jgi:hypothetical protein
MNTTTGLERLEPARARELLQMMGETRRYPNQGLALDERGYVTGCVPVDDQQQEHLLGDFDVHA